MSPLVRLRTSSTLEDGLALTGVPFARGSVAPEARLELAHGGRPLPLWHDVRSLWPDGSVKWVFLHARVPAGRCELELSVLPGPAASLAPPELSAGELRAGGMALGSANGAVRCVTPHGEWQMESDEVETELERPPSDRALRLELVEPSPLAPLARIRAPLGSGADRPSGLLLEYLARMDPVHARLILERRMCWNRAGRFTLRSACARLRLGAAQAGSGRIVAPAPGALLAPDGSAAPGFPEGRADLEGFSLWLEKAWQRAPFGLAWSGDTVDVSFYAPEAAPLGVTGGTSFRHTLHLACGPRAAEAAGACVEVLIDPEHLACSGALGMIVDPSRARHDFPGYEHSFRATLESGRIGKLSHPGADGTVEPDGEAAPLEEETRQDPEYFGLQHYGDWPMPWGSYGIKARRMYASSEYDPAYAYFQGYAMYGQWRYREIARHCAVHMTDVDIVSTTGDMRYHGYYDGAEDHQHARSEGELGHYWTDGYWMLHFLCGDLWAREAALGVTEFLVRRFSRGGEDHLRAVWSGAERNLGWPMVALVGSCEAVGHQGALDTIRRIVAFVERYTADPDRDFEEETGSAEQPISWWRTAMQDGCKPFMVGVVLEGLERYHRLTGDPRAAAAVVALARWAIDATWLPHEATFIYEYNGFGRAHRLAKPHDLIPLFVRGLGYAYELTGDERIREVSEKAFHGCLWTLYSPGSGGKSIGMMGRTLGAYVAMLDAWNRRDRERARASIAPSAAPALRFSGTVAELLGSGEIELVRGRPRYEGEALVSDAGSFVEARFRSPRSTNAGAIALRVWLAPGSTTWLNKRALVHLSDDLHTSAAVSVIVFYTNLHVRVYDARRDIVEVAEGFIKDVDVKGARVEGKGYPAWEEGEWHQVEVSWRIPSAGRPGEVTLAVDGVLADRRELDRAIGGRFTRLSLGHRPGNWRLLGKLELERLWLGERPPS